MYYRHVSVPVSDASRINAIVAEAIRTSPQNPVEALEKTLVLMRDVVSQSMRAVPSPREIEVHDAAFRLYLARHMESLYAQIFRDMTYETAIDLIQKRGEDGTWSKLTDAEWAPVERECMKRPVRYSRIILSTLLATIPTQIIAFVFLPLQAASQTYSEKDPRSPSIVARIGLKENPRHPTETPIHDHQAPCTGATVFQDSKSFTIEDRFKFIADSVIDRLPVTTVDFAKQRVWCDPFKPVTDLKTGLHPHVIHRVGHHSYESAVTPSLRVHIYGSLTPNQRMDYSFVKRAFSTEDIPEKREEFLFGHTSFFRGMAAHEAAF